MFDIICFVVGTVLGAGLTMYILEQKKWPVKIQQMQEEVEARVKQETLQCNAATVRPVMGEVIAHIQEVVNIVEDAVLELIVRFQEITDAAIQDANIFRAIHTVKGTCSFLGYSKLESLAHTGETLLSLLRDGDLSLTPAIASALLKMVDAIRQMLACIQETTMDVFQVLTGLVRLG